MPDVMIVLRVHVEAGTDFSEVGGDATAVEYATALKGWIDHRICGPTTLIDAYWLPDQ